MTRQTRSRLLGDTEESAPEKWEFGGSAQTPIHAVVIVHAVSEAALDRASEAQRALLADTAGGVSELAGTMQIGYRPDADHEPFGFHDGRLCDAVAGIAGEGVPTGEFILGYPNHYGFVPPGPVVPREFDADGLLPTLDNPYHAQGSLHDLGLNGSYVVYRKLQQDVVGFWRFMKEEAVRFKGEEDAAYMVWLAARCVGRWPGGAALALSPLTDDPQLRDRDDFYYRDDPHGWACPLGAHVRRTNPRDDIKPYPATESLSMSEAHRLLRRARVFGPPLLAPADLANPASDACRSRLLALTDDGRARGIHFFCVNASIRSQFEFVQQTWCNNPRFGGLNDNKDPISGDNGRSGEPRSRMTISTPPRQLRTSPLPRFVGVRAGAYLFMPGLTALRFLGVMKTTYSAAPAASSE
jgi:deferrochelatase/peroxidase EfeB